MIFIVLDTLGVTQLALHIYEGFLVRMHSSIADTQTQTLTDVLIKMGIVSRMTNILPVFLQELQKHYHYYDNQ